MATALAILGLYDARRAHYHLYAPQSALRQAQTDCARYAMQTLSGALKTLFLPIALLVAGAAHAGSGQHAVASAHPDATAAGIEILQAGGNAFDAAVAVSAALAVAEPSGSGMGGGGFWLLHVAKTGKQVMVDGRETAPAAASADMYRNDAGKVVESLSRNGPLAAAIPGQAAALAYLAEKYGRLPLKQSLVPAIQLARDGVPVDAPMLARLAWRFDVMARSPATAAVFHPGGSLPDPGQRLPQTDLADTLQRLGDQGKKGFYEGVTAQRLVDGVRNAGGIWTLKDLQDYAVVERPVITQQFGGWTLTLPPPPSSGGVVITQVFKVLERLGYADLGSVDRKHVVVEALRTAYRDRAAWLGDPDHVDMPLARLMSDDYATWTANRIDLKQARSSADMASPVKVYEGGTDTTHFSVIDADGNRVSATLSVNLPFGSGFMSPGTGVLLNDEMDDFSAKPGVPNAYGLVGTDANAVGPGRRPLSSMTPSFVEGNGKVIALGTPGGSRIITMVLLGMLTAMDGGDAAAIVGAPRYHHQYLPDEIYFEPDALTADEQGTLRARGFSLRESGRDYGNMHAVVWDKAAKTLDAASDPRGIGRALVEPARAER